MGGTVQTQNQQQQTQTANPVAEAALSPFGPIGLGVAQTPYNVGMNTNVAGQNPQQLAAIQGLGGLQTNNPANSYINQAALYSNQAADPNSVINMQKAFYNPMSQQVIGQMENVFGQQSAQQLGNAAASGAIGGSRAPIAAENLINQQDLALGQTLSGLQQQALGAAQTQQGQIGQQAFTQGQLGNEALNTQIQGINQALLGGQLTQQQAQAQLNAIQQNSIAQTLFPGQMAAQGENIAMGTTALGGTTTGQGTSTQPVNYFGQILGAVGAGAGAYAASDERVKENIEPIGKSFDKQTIYKFNYIGDPSPRIGLIAQEVEKKHPGAVKEINGTKAVDYNKATAKSAEMGEHRQHRAIGGGTGVGNGTSGLLGYSGIQSGLQPYFAQSPQVQVPQMHFPTVNLTPGQNTAQQQQDQQAQQFSQLGTALGKSGIGGQVSDYFSGPSAQDYENPGLYSQGGRIRMQDGGDPSSIQTANDAFLANNQGFGLGLIPSANAAVPSNGWQPTIETAQPLATPQTPSPISANAAPVPEATEMGTQARTPGPGQYVAMGYDGRPIGAPQLSGRDPALVRQAAIASPAQTPAPIATPPAQVLSQSGVDLIKGFEGYRARPYQDGSRMSIGYGTSASSPNQFLSPEHAEAELVRSATPVNQWIKQNITADLTQPQKDALLSYGYHAGVGHLNNLKDAINSGNLDAAGQAMLASVHSDNPDMEKGLQARMSKEAAMLAGHAVQPDQRSGLQDPSLQPPKPGESALDQRMAEFGFKPNQPQGPGSMLANALGIKPAQDPRLGNFLTRAGFAAMASPPTVGIKGFPGAAISALNATGKGGLSAMDQEQQERTQAINMANAATRQQLEQAQTQRALKPEWQTIRKELVPTIDPVTKMTYWKEREVKGWVNPFTQEITEGQQPPVAPLQTPGSTPSSANAAPASSSALPGGVTFTQADGSEAPVPTAIAEKFNPEDPVDQLSLRILSGQAHMPKTQREDPRYIALKKRVYELDPTYNENRSDFYKQYGGPNGKTQLSYDAFGTALKHAHDLDDANWNNNLTDTGWSPLTTIPQAIQRARGNPKLKNYEEAATAYADEHYRTLVPSGAGTQKERERAESTVAASTPRQGRLAGNAENVSILLGKMLKLDDKYNRNMGIAASINKPPMLTEDDRQTIRDIFTHEPDQDLKKQRYERYSKDPRTADLVSPPAKAATKETSAAAPAQPKQTAPTTAPAMPQRPPNVPANAGYSAKTGKWYDPVTHQPIE